MAAAEVDNDLPDEIVDSLEDFYHSMNAVEETLKPMLSSYDDVHEQLDVLDRAKLDLMTVYAMNSMFWIYLVTQGINPKEHAVKHELDRVKTYMGKIKEVADKKKASLKIDKDAAKRFVKNALCGLEDKRETKDEPSKTSRKEKRKKESHSQKRKRQKKDK